MPKSPRKSPCYDANLLRQTLQNLLLDFHERNAAADPPRNPYSFDSVKQANLLLEGHPYDNPAVDCLLRDRGQPPAKPEQL